MTNSIPEIEDASCVLVMGSNTTEAHPLVSHRVYRAKLKGATLIVVDPRKIQLTLAADIHVRLNFGSDVALHQRDDARHPEEQLAQSGVRF